jgi:hypothetical protein
MAKSPILIVRDKIKELILEKSELLENLREDDVFFTDVEEIFRAPVAMIVFQTMSLRKETTHQSILRLAYKITIKLRGIDYLEWEDRLSRYLYEMMLWFQRHPNLGCDVGAVYSEVDTGIIGELPDPDSNQSVYYFGFDISVNYGLVDTSVEGY